MAFIYFHMLSFSRASHPQRLQVLRQSAPEPRSASRGARASRLRRLDLRSRRRDGSRDSDRTDGEGRSSSLEGLRRRTLRAAAEPSPRLEG